LERISALSAEVANPEGIAAYREHVGNVRAALQWSFSDSGDNAIATALAVSSAPLLMTVSPMVECRSWIRRAIAALDDGTRGTTREMELQEALAFSLIITRGSRDDSRAAFTRGLEIADDLGDSLSQLRLMSGLHGVLLMLYADLPSALALAQRNEAIAARISDSAKIREGSSMLGLAYHYMGNQDTAQTHIDAGLMRVSQLKSLFMARSDYSTRGQDLCTLARILWLRGYADQSSLIARQTLAEAEALGHPIILSILLFYLIQVFLWTGDYVTAGVSIERLLALSEKQDLALFHGLGLGFKGELLIKRGEADAGIRLLRGYMDALTAGENNPQVSAFCAALAQGQLTVGLVDEALKTVNGAIALAAESGSLFYMPELLRIRAEILTAASHPDEVAAEALLLESIALARSQSALAWELRSATSLAILRYKQGRGVVAREVLEPVYQQFVEGFNSADLITAKRLLEEFV
jgi:tetratricopeptide (TPR) repeat protein